jgi:D-xylose transport system permease protein
MKNPAKDDFKRAIIRKYGNLIGLVFLIVLTTILTNGLFFTQRNLINVLRQVSVNGILAVGMTLVIIIGGIDLSVGSVVALTGVIVALSQPLGTVPAVILTLLAGAFIGGWNGFFVTKFRIPSFIITLGMMTIARGLALVFSKGQAVSGLNGDFLAISESYIPPAISLLIFIFICLVAAAVALKDRRSSAYERKIFTVDLISVLNGLFITAAVVILVWLIGFRGMPAGAAVFLGIAFLGAYTLNQTRFGRYIYAIGGNEEASRLSGINVKLVKFLVFLIMGVLASVSGMVLAARLNSGVPTSGVMFELDAIASVVIGGTSLSGGYGSVSGSIIGAFIIGTLNNGMQLLHIDPFYQEIAKGIIIIGAVLMDRKKK